MAGRKPKPTHLKLLQGNPGKRPLNQREPKPNGNLKTAPSHFSAEQLEVWNYAIEHAPPGLLKKLDLSTLEVWATACVLHRQAVELVRKDGLTVAAPSGYLMANPALSILNTQANTMIKSAGDLGFTPSSRSRISIAEEVDQNDPWAQLAAEG